MEYRVQTVHSFTIDGKGGNPAGVVLVKQPLSPATMQRIASAVGYSETVFIEPGHAGEWAASFFTPTSEVDLCGHATIAAFFLLAQSGLIGVGRYKQRTKAGLLQVEVNENSGVFMQQPAPVFSNEALDTAAICASLDLVHSDLNERLPLQIVSTCARDLLIPLRSSENLSLVRPDLERISGLSEQYNVVSFHLFSLSEEHGNTAQCRNFAPRVGIAEDPATGVTSGALACYLYHHLGPQAGNQFTFEQGYEIGKQCQIKARLVTRGAEVSEVWVGGKAKFGKDKLVKV